MFPQGLAQRSLCQFVAIIVDLADMAVPFLLVIFRGGAFADVMEIDVSQCDVESPSFLQLKHQGEQAEQDILQLLVTSAGISRPGVSQPGVVYKCNVTHNPDFSQDCADLTTGRIPAGVPFSFVWEVEVLPEPHRGFLAMSAQSPTNDGSIVQCPEVGPCRALLPKVGAYQGEVECFQSGTSIPKHMAKNPMADQRVRLRASKAGSSQHAQLENSNKLMCVQYDSIHHNCSNDLHHNFQFLYAAPGLKLDRH